MDETKSPTKTPKHEQIQNNFNATSKRIIESLNGLASKVGNLKQRIDNEPMDKVLLEDEGDRNLAALYGLGQLLENFPGQIDSFSDSVNDIIDIINKDLNVISDRLF